MGRQHGHQVGDGRLLDRYDPRRAPLPPRSKPRRLCVLIGLLKALGSTQGMTRRIFLWKGLFIVGLGIVLGNAIGLGLAYTQITWGWITLPEKAYYVSKAPLSIDMVWIIIINCFSIVWSTLVLFIPLSLINRIQPVRALRFA